MHWKIEYYSEVVQRAILALPAGLLARYIHLTDRMIAFGPNLGMPHTLLMDKGLFELRLKAADREGIFLHANRATHRDAAPVREEDTKDAIEGTQYCQAQNEGVAECLVTVR